MSNSNYLRMSRNYKIKSLNCWNKDEKQHERTRKDGMFSNEPYKIKSG